MEEKGGTKFRTKTHTQKNVLAALFLTTPRARPTVARGRRGVEGKKAFGHLAQMRLHGRERRRRKEGGT